METEQQTKPLTYDYRSVRVKREMEAIVTDAYETLGYQVTSTQMAQGSLNHVVVSFKRDRKINNKMELVKVQQKVDTTLSNIEKIQSQKNNAGIVEGITVGVIGALTFGGGMSMVMCLSGLPYLIGGIALGIVGIGIGLLGWLTHNKVQKKKLSQLEPAYQSELDKLSDLCDEANKLK